MMLNQNSIKLNKNLDSESNEKEETQSELERLEKIRIAIELEDARRKKIELGKVSYKVSRANYHKFFPRLKKKIASSSESISSSEEKERSIPKFHFTPEPSLKKKIDRFKDIKSNYLSPTLSFSFALKGPEWLREVKKDSFKKKIVKNTTAFSPTQFSLQKIKNKKVFHKSNKPSWNINTILPDIYSPSIFSSKMHDLVKENDKSIKNSPRIKLNLNKESNEKCNSNNMANRIIERLDYERQLPELALRSKNYNARKQKKVQFL